MGRANAAVTGSGKAEEVQSANPFSQDQVTALKQLLSQVMSSGQSSQNSAEVYTSLFANNDNNPTAYRLESKNSES
ncbi:hypothetical protein LINPERPRIM_LOCUS6686 [Linum perenne]